MFGQRADSQTVCSCSSLSLRLRDVTAGKCVVGFRSQEGKRGAGSGRIWISESAKQLVFSQIRLFKAGLLELGPGLGDGGGVGKRPHEDAVKRIAWFGRHYHAKPLPAE